MPRPPFRISALAVLLALAGTGPALACFGSDPGAASTNVSDHLGWAQSRDRAALSDNLAGKLHALDRCGGGDDQMRDVFADLSIIIARYAPRVECYNGDSGAGVTVRQAHRDWAAMRSRQDLMTNLLSKTSAAMTCLDQAGQARLFADLSVVIAKAAQGVQAPAPGKVVWQLANVVIKDIAPSGTKFLRIDEAQADSKGGSIRITALNEGECAPGQGVPNKPLEERFLFRWRFDRDVTRIAHPEKFDVVFSIDGDGIVPCFDLNPYMAADGDGRALDVRQGGGARFQFATPHYFHVGNPRTVEVYNPESGLERGTIAMTPMFRVSITGFRGNRGMVLEALYSYTLVK